MAESVAEGCGVMLTQNIAAVRLCSDPKHGWWIEVGDIRTGKSVEIRVTAAGQKVKVVHD